MYDEIFTSDLREVTRQGDPIDYLVIGSGTAGVTAALALAQAGNHVVMLEAGPFILPEHVGSSPFRSRGDIVPQIHERAVYHPAWITHEDYDALGEGVPEGNNNAWSLVGGRTVFWGGCTPRFQSWDFDDWPLDLADLEPWYLKAEQRIHVSGGTREDHPAFFRSPGQDRLIDKLNQAGIAARRAALGVDTEEVRNGHISRGFDSSVARLLRSGLLALHRSGPGITLVSETEALRLQTRGRRVTGVEALDRRDGSRHTVAANHVILAGGAVQSTRLALASGLDDPSGLIGHHVNDHLFVQGVIKLDKPVEEGPLYIFLEPTPEQPYHVQIQGPFKETWYSPYHATVWLNPDPDGHYVLFYVFGIATMEKENRVVLRPRGDGPAMHDYVVVYDRSEQDVAVLEAMRAIMPRVAQTLGGSVVKDQINNPGASLHEVGGLRMSADPATGVTDPVGRFWAYDNLAAADASIWPSQGTANSYLTITAMALRLGEALAAGKTRPGDGVP